MSEQLAVLKEILENLVEIRQLMELHLRKLIKEELESVASTPERKKMWILLLAQIMIVYSNPLLNF